MNAPLFNGPPQELPSLLAPVQSFNPQLLPDRFRPWILDIAERLQCPVDFPAVAAMTALAAVVGRRVGVRPQAKTDWTAVPNLWGMVIGRPGIMKTPAINETLKPLRRLECDAQQEHLRQVQSFDADMLIRDAQRKQTEKDIAAAIKKDPDGARALAHRLVADEPHRPTRTRFLVNDATVEMLGQLLKENPLGHILCYRDELAGWLAGLDRKGQEQARTFYLEAWDGNGRFTYDRIGRGTIDIEAATVSLLGGIQPGPLQKYLTATGDAGGDDGLIQRFQLMVWPDVSKEWRNVDRWPDSVARDEAWKLFQHLAKLDPHSIGAQSDDHGGIPFIRFDAAAIEAFVDWRDNVEPHVRSGNENLAMESHLAKYRSLIPSLALLCHLAGPCNGSVGLADYQRALEWAVYLESHARRVYGAKTDERIGAARELAKRIKGGQVESRFASRDVYRKGWSGLADSFMVEQAADILIDHDWLAVESVATRGRTATVYHVNPALIDSQTPF